MMLRTAVARVLFDRHPGHLLNNEIEICNKFIDDYHTVRKMMELEV